MVSTIQTLIPYSVLVSHAVFTLFLLAVIYRKSWGRSIVKAIGERAISLGFIAALAAITGSLLYSEIVGWEPCVLCWWQRVFIYPQAVLFGVALWRKKRGVFMYAVPLSLLGSVVSLYHEYVYMGGTSILPCTALGGACSKIYVLSFGYITIPMMALTITLFILLFAHMHKIYENSHSR